jgi:VanZ family protein
VKIKKILFKLPGPLTAAGIWALSSQSTLPRPKGILGYDKLQHLLAYAVLAAALGLWISPAFWKRRPRAALCIVSLIGAVYGVIDEIHQYFVPGRDCNIWDWLADALGAGIGAAAALAALRITEKCRMKKNESA